MNMEAIEKATSFLNIKLRNISTSDRIVLSRQAKEYVLSINQIYKNTKEPKLMELMKLITAKKNKIEKKLYKQLESF